MKSIYGIYKKVYSQHKSIDEIYDKYAVRVIVTTVNECYSVLGLVHDMFRPIPNRFKDYIANPKQNGYQSLHTSVLGKEGIPFEVQIRTWEMHANAEYGVAAHWKYKERIQGKTVMDSRIAWIRQVLETLREVIPGGEEQTGPDGEHFSVLEAGGFSCIGYVEVPESKLAWPVEDAKGSGGVIPFLADDTDGKLLIRGPRALFESLSDVKVGSRVILTDVYGVSRSYEVISSGLVDDADKIERTDLILCTKDSFSGLYVVSCRAEQ